MLCLMLVEHINHRRTERGKTDQPKLFVMDTEQNRIVQMLRDRHILITGGTGFMGKVLIEKILRYAKQVDAVAQAPFIDDLVEN